MTINKFESADNTNDEDAREAVNRFMEDIGAGFRANEDTVMAPDDADHLTVSMLRGVLEKQPDERRVTIVVGIPGHGSQVFTEVLAVSHAYDSKINENIVVIHVMPEVN